MPANQLENPTPPTTHYNANLNKYDNVVLFPEKVAKAKASLSEARAAKLRAVTKK